MTVTFSDFVSIVKYIYIYTLYFLTTWISHF